MAPKRPHKSLTLAQKQDILKKLKNGVSGKVLAEKYGIGKSTVFDIKKNEDKIKGYIANCVSNLTRKNLREPEYPKMENELYKWYQLQRDEQATVNNAILREMALQIYPKHYSDLNFTASKGWVSRFKNRFGIRKTSEKKSNEIINEVISDPLEFGADSESEGEDVPMAVRKEGPPTVDEDRKVFGEIGGVFLREINTEDCQVGKSEVAEWNECDEYKLMVERDGCTFDGNGSGSKLRKVAHDEGVRSFSVCIQWAEENQVDLNSLSVLRRLRQRVIEAKHGRQTKITDFFQYKY